MKTKCNKNITSSCKIQGPSTISCTPNERTEFFLILSCNSTYSDSQWWGTYGSIEVNINYQNQNPSSPGFIIYAPSGAEGRGGFILTEWCDAQGGYINFTTTFLINTSSPNASNQNRGSDAGVLSYGSKSCNASASTTVNAASTTTTESSQNSQSSNRKITLAIVVLVSAAAGILVAMLGIMYFNYRERKAHPLTEVAAPTQQELDTPSQWTAPTVPQT